MRIHRIGRNQEGSTLLEVLVALVLISVVVLALVNGLLTSAKSDNSSKGTQKMNAALNSFSEVLKEEINYQPCADPGWYQAVYVDALAGMADDNERRTRYGIVSASNVEVTRVEYWIPQSFPVDESGSPIGSRTNGEFSPTCGNDSGTQRISFKARYAGRERSGQVVKRDPKGLGFDDFVAPTTSIAAGNNPPLARFTATSDPTACAGCWTFVSTSVDPGGSIASYSWDFADATAPATTESVTHSFGPGLYKVRLTVTDNEGATSSATRTVVLAGTPNMVSNFRLIRIRHGGGVAAIYDFGWTRLPGVQEYEIRVRWCWRIIWEWCEGGESYRFGDVAGGSVPQNSPSIPGVEAQIRARVGDNWGPWSPAIRAWRT